MEGYEPLQDGNIPPEVQTIESVGEACHDFTIARSKLSVVNLRKQLIHEIQMEQYQKTEHDISKLLHTAFNGTGGNIKANLDLSDTSKVYTNPALLESELFFGDDGVNPLVFTVAAANLGTFQPLLEKLSDRLEQTYLVDKKVTHDAYSRPGLLGNPFNASIIYSAATTCDSGVAGSSADVLQTAMRENRFILDSPLVSGTSFWGNWTIQTNTTPAGKYGGANVTITINDIIIPITIGLPAALTRSPSVNELSIMLDGVISKRTPDQILISINKNLSAPAIRTFYTSFIGHMERLYRANKFNALKFVFIWKELGDMSQHLVAVTKKHLAGGSVDGLSTIAFLKRGVPCSYIIASIKGLDHVRFRVAGNSHIQGDPVKAAKRKRDAEAAAEKRNVALAKRKEEKAAMKEAIRVAARAEQEAIDRARALAKAAAAARRAGRTGVLTGGSRWKKTERKLRKRRNKTYKQKGGARDLIEKIIDALFDYLTEALAGGGGGPDLPAECSLFNAKDVPLEEGISEYIDLTIVVQDDGNNNIFMDNALLGLPLASIIYLLGEKLKGEPLTTKNVNTIVDDFLKSFNFTDSEIEYIMAKISTPRDATAAPSGSLTIGNILREATDSDKAVLQVLVHNYGAIIPGFVINEPEVLPEEEVTATGAGTATPPRNSKPSLLPFGTPPPQRKFSASSNADGEFNEEVAEAALEEAGGVTSLMKQFGNTGFYSPPPLQVETQAPQQHNSQEAEATEEAGAGAGARAGERKTPRYQNTERESPNPVKRERATPKSHLSGSPKLGVSALSGLSGSPRFGVAPSPRFGVAPSPRFGAAPSPRFGVAPRASPTPYSQRSIPRRRSSKLKRSRKNSTFKK
jgi:hypothetical protein